MITAIVISGLVTAFALGLLVVRWRIEAGRERTGHQVWDAPPGRHRGPVKHAGRPPLDPPALLALPAGPDMPAAGDGHSALWQPRDAEADALFESTYKTTLAARLDVELTRSMLFLPGPEPDDLDRLVHAYETATEGGSPWLASGTGPVKYAGRPAPAQPAAKPATQPATAPAPPQAPAEQPGPQPYCARPRCENRHGHWTGEHPQPGPVAAALAAERERATRLPDYALDEMGGHLTVDSLLDSIVGHVFAPAGEADGDG